VIQEPLQEDGAKSLSGGVIDVAASGAEAAPDDGDVRSPETYIGYRHAAHLASAESIAQDSARLIDFPSIGRLWARFGRLGQKARRCMPRLARLCSGFRRAIFISCSDLRTMAGDSFRS
jgi:hypothetical protein